jgi:hypothetical protein
MKMYFNHDIAWETLKRNGVVTTLRGDGPTPHEVRVRIWRHGKDTGLRGVRRFLRNVFHDKAYDLIMEDALPDSGFSTVDEWWSAAIEMSGEQEVWRLFRVELEDHR